MSGIHWVLLPGLDGTGRLFEGFAPYLPRSRTTVVTYPANAEWSIEDYVAHADAAIPRGVPCILVAESFSGPIALRLLARDIVVCGAVLVASFVACPHPLLKALPLRPAVALRGMLLSKAALRAFCLGWQASDAQVETLREIIKALPVDVLLSRLRLLRDLDEEEGLARAQVPLLLLDAADDKLVRSRAGRTGAHVQRTVIDGPHFLLQSCAEPCWKTIAAWWRHLT